MRGNRGLESGRSDNKTIIVVSEQVPISSISEPELTEQIGSGFR